MRRFIRHRTKAPSADSPDLSVLAGKFSICHRQQSVTMNCISPLSYSCGPVLHTFRAFPLDPPIPGPEGQRSMPHQSNDPNTRRPDHQQLTSIIPKTLLLVKQICPRAPQVDDLRTPIAILFQARTLEAIERVTDTLTTAHDALVLVVAE